MIHRSRNVEVIEKGIANNDMLSLLLGSIKLRPCAWELDERVQKNRSERHTEWSSVHLFSSCNLTQ